MLVDFLTLLAHWLQANPSASLNCTQLSLVVMLLDCSSQHCPVSRAQKVLECICSILSNHQREWKEASWNEEVRNFELKKKIKIIL